MTLFGKILIGLLLATAAVLIVKDSGKDEVVVVEETGEQTPAAPTEIPADARRFEGSTAELIARGGDHMCTFDQTVENSHSTGTVYVSGGKMRGDFKSDVNAVGTNMSVESHMISDGEFMWSWSNMMPSGFKMKIDQTATPSNGAGQGAFDANMKLAYDCDPWTPDASKFTLPSAITFTEIKI